MADKSKGATIFIVFLGMLLIAVGGVGLSYVFLMRKSKPMELAPMPREVTDENELRIIAQVPHMPREVTDPDELNLIAKNFTGMIEEDEPTRIVLPFPRETTEIPPPEPVTLPFPREVVEP